jgi:NADH-quinone oxidoreductase subunit H
MDIWYIIGQALIGFIIINLSLVAVAYIIYGERKVSAHMQGRIGPNRAGPIGLFQSFADLIKMLKKEDTTPKDSDKVVFFIAPIVGTFTMLGALVVMPFGPPANVPGGIDFFGLINLNWFASQVNVGALLILALSSLGVYGIIMAGWGSNSKYALLGGLRSSSQVISYEITLGISLIGVFLLAGSLNMSDIVLAQYPHVTGGPAVPGTPGIWLILLQPVGFLIFFVSAVAEMNRIPFDLTEAEGELVSGYHTEYSGLRFGLFQLAEFGATLVIGAAVTTFFLGGWLSPFEGLLHGTDIPFITGLLSSGPWWFILKIAAFIFVLYWVRWTLPRFRYDQLMGLCWKVLLPLTLLNIMVIAVLKLIFFPPGTTPDQFAANGWYWWIIVVIELIFGALALIGLSRLAGLSWFGRAERPVLVERSVILVKTAQGGRGTIEGEARTVGVTRE